jgi:hypothetical protein
MTDRQHGDLRDGPEALAYIPPADTSTSGSRAGSPHAGAGDGSVRYRYRACGSTSEPASYLRGSSAAWAERAQRRRARTFAHVDRRAKAARDYPSCPRPSDHHRRDMSVPPPRPERQGASRCATAPAHRPVVTNFTGEREASPFRRPRTRPDRYSTTIFAADQAR